MVLLEQVATVDERLSPGDLANKAFSRCGGAGLSRNFDFMMVYQSYQFYQAERPKTAAEMRRADEQLGYMAEGVSRLWRQVTRALALFR